MEMHLYPPDDLRIEACTNSGPIVPLKKEEFATRSLIFAQGENLMAKISVVYADWCPSCPGTKSFWKNLRNDIPFQYEEIDIDSEKGKEMAERLSIQSVPTTLVNGRVYFVGKPEKSRAIQVLKSLG